MAWPTRAEFNVMMQNPRIAFRDKQLHAVEIERGASDMPRARAGAFADVYRAIFPNQQSQAIRVFASDQPERLERYRAIYEHLSSQKLGCIVPFTYSDNGMRAANGKWYPLITMDWVKGDTLFDWLEKKTVVNDGRSIGAMAEKWRETVQGLARAQIAHCDLQHANIMITDSEEIKLVDYDGMCVPKIVGRRNEEMGVVPYQHPDRNGGTQLSLSLDNFSSAFIYVGLKALSSDPTLWQEFVVAPSYDKILFRKEDLEEPSQSPLFSRLRRSPDGEVQRLAAKLGELWRVHIDQVPSIAEMLFSFDHVKVLLDQRDFDGAIELITRNNKKPVDAPPDMQPRLKDAQQRVTKLAELTAAVSAANEGIMASLAGSPLLQGYPKAVNAVSIAVDASSVLQAIGRLDLARGAERWRDLVKEWDTSLPVFKRPNGNLRKSVVGYESEVNSWRERNSLCDKCLAIIGAANPDVSVLAGFWNKLDGLGGHPECASRRTEVETLVARERAWQTFQALPQTIDEQTDKSVVATWKESLFKGWPKADAERGRLDGARQRLKMADDVTAAAGGSLTKPSEEQVVCLAKKLPAGYASAITNRVETAKKRLGAAAAISTAVQADSDLQIATAFHALESLQAGVLVESADQARIATALKREIVVSKLAKIPTGYTPAQALQWDSKILDAWDETLLKGCRDSISWKPTVETALRRRNLLGELEKAIATQSVFLLYDIAADSCLTGYPFPVNIARLLKTATADVGAVRGIMNALKTGDRVEFVRAFHARVLREHAPTFQPYWELILNWVQSDILPNERLGLQPPIAQRPLEIEVDSVSKTSRCELRWKWPESRFSDECRVLLCRNRPAASQSPDGIAAWLKFPMTRDMYQQAGGYRIVHADAAWKGCYVVVWARIDLGSNVLWSEPLVLGKV